MQEHATYWKGVTNEGSAIVFGLGWLVSLKLRMKQMHMLLADMTGLRFEVYAMPDAGSAKMRDNSG